MPTSRGQYTLPITRPWLPDLGRYEEVVRDVFQSRYLSNFGKYSRLLEERAAGILDHPDPKAVVSCDIGLSLAWRALGCREGEIITPSFTFCSTVNSIRWNGLVPVFADIDPDTFCVDVDHMRRLIGPKTVGIAAVHVFGCPAPLEPLEELAREHNLKLIIDAAHGLGALHNGLGMGAFGDASVFSLSGTKLVTSGEGGLITFRSEEASEHFRALRNYGFLGDYNCFDLGLNGKISELNAAMGWLSLEMMEEMVARRHELVAEYRRQLASVPGLRFQECPATDRHPYKDFALLFEHPEQVALVEQALDSQGVQTKRYFLPVHKMSAYRAFARGPLPITDQVYRRILCVPLFHDLSGDQMRLVTDTVCRVVGSEGGMRAAV